MSIFKIKLTQRHSSLGIGVPLNTFVLLRNIFLFKSSFQYLKRKKCYFLVSNICQNQIKIKTLSSLFSVIALSKQEVTYLSKDYTSIWYFRVLEYFCCIRSLVTRQFPSWKLISFENHYIAYTYTENSFKIKKLQNK